MKLTKSQLKQIIKEELERINEAEADRPYDFDPEEGLPLTSRGANMCLKDLACAERWKVTQPDKFKAYMASSGATPRGATPPKRLDLSKAGRRPAVKNEPGHKPVKTTGSTKPSNNQDLTIISQRIDDLEDDFQIFRKQVIALIKSKKT